MADSQFQNWSDPPERQPSAGQSVDGRSMWTGGLATALVAALVAVVGVLVIRGVFGVPIIAPGNTEGSIDYVGAVWLAVFAAVGALLATAIAHVLLLVTPRPMTFFGWIVGLVTLVFVVWPFSVAVGIEVRVANALLYLLIGVAIGTLLVGAAGSAVRRAAGRR